MGPPTGRAPVVDDIRPPQSEPPQHEQQQQLHQQQLQQQQQQQRYTVNGYQSTQPHPSNPLDTHQIHPQTRTRPAHNTQPQDSTINNVTPSVSSTQYPVDLSPQGNDNTDGPLYSHVNVRVDVSTEQEVCESTPDLLTSFIVGRMERDGYSVPPALSSRNRKNESDIAHVLRDIGDDIMKNYQLNHYISEIQVTPNTAYKTFASVASQIFTDGNINWGRIVMLFYFAYKLALQVLNQLPLIDIIIGWVKQFVADKLATWISSRGGWNSIAEYYRSTNTQMIGMFLAGVLVASLFWYLRRK